MVIDPKAPFKTILSYLTDPGTGQLSHTRIGSILAQILGAFVMVHGYLHGLVTVPEVITYVGVVIGNGTLSKAAGYWKQTKDGQLKASVEHLNPTPKVPTNETQS